MKAMADSRAPILHRAERPDQIEQTPCIEEGLTTQALEDVAGEGTISG